MKHKNMTVKDILRTMEKDEKVTILDSKTNERLETSSTCSYLLGFEIVIIDEEDERIRNMLGCEVVKIKLNKTFGDIELSIIW